MEKSGDDGEPGTPGQPGPTGNGIASTSKTGTSGLVDTYTITYTDGRTETFTVTNGRDGTNGTNGTNGVDGQDGFSPILSETQTSTGYDISITDVNGTRTISLLNGQGGNADPQIFYWDGSTDSTGLAFWNEVYQAQKEKPCIVIHTKQIRGNYITFTWNYNNNMPTSVFESTNKNVYSRVTSLVSQSTGFSKLNINWVSVYFTITNDTVTQINTNSGTSTASFLSTTDDYFQIYTPLYNGSPATKKYVDDSITNAISGLNTTLTSIEGVVG